MLGCSGPLGTLGDNDFFDVRVPSRVVSVTKSRIFLGGIGRSLNRPSGKSSGEKEAVQSKSLSGNESSVFLGGTGLSQNRLGGNGSGEEGAGLGKEKAGDDGLSNGKERDSSCVNRVF